LYGTTITTDLLLMKCHIPEDMKADVEKYRAELIEAVAEYDEDLLEKFFEDPDSISPDEIHEALRAALKT